MGEAVDVLAALPGRVEFAQKTAGITRFNQSPFHAWNAGFRECAMLARGSEYGMADENARRRVQAWTTSQSGEFAAYAATGAREGIAFACDAARDPQSFDHLNDPPGCGRGSPPHTQNRRLPDERPGRAHRAVCEPPGWPPPAHAGGTRPGTSRQRDHRAARNRRWGGGCPARGRRPADRTGRTSCGRPSGRLPAGGRGSPRSGSEPFARAAVPRAFGGCPTRSPSSPAA